LSKHKHLFFINTLMFINEIIALATILPKVGVATICGALVGWERERRNKVAGIRTNILICVGSCIFTIVSFLAAQQFSLSDPTRILSTIVTGIGFLGAGAIIQNKDKIIGLTTAAFIWTISAIGILCGMGLTLTPIVLTIGLIFISHFFEKVERWMKKDTEDDRD
jgi:putative Mg2+ transporter-C (MgtC) family protein